MDKLKWWVYPLSLICFLLIVVFGTVVFRIFFNLLNLLSPRYFQRDSFGIIFISDIASALAACSVLTAMTKGKATKFCFITFVLTAAYILFITIWNFSHGYCEFVDLCSLVFNDDERMVFVRAFLVTEEVTVAEADFSVCKPSPVSPCYILRNRPAFVLREG